MSLLAILENYINNLEQQNQRLQQELQVLQNTIKQQHDSMPKKRPSSNYK
tara:strand:+ start:660 stop:809 length:150 start_codon:yes stop_codon:yes gene_type:complete